MPLNQPFSLRSTRTFVYLNWFTQVDFFKHPNNSEKAYAADSFFSVGRHFLFVSYIFFSIGIAMKVVKITAITARDFFPVEINPLVNPRLAIIRHISPLGVIGLSVNAS